MIENDIAHRVASKLTEEVKPMLTKTVIRAFAEGTYISVLAMFCPTFPTDRLVGGKKHRTLIVPTAIGNNADELYGQSTLVLAKCG
mgnify:CR=1 FL=1